MHQRASRLDKSGCDILKWIIPRLPRLVHSDIIASVSLIDVDIPLKCTTINALEMTERRRTHPFSHVVPMLSRMNPSFQRRSPRCSVHRRPLVSRASKGLPINEERYGVFCLWYTVVGFPCSYTGSSTRDDPSRYGLVLQDPTTNVDVMRRKIVTGKRSD